MVDGDLFGGKLKVDGSIFFNCFLDSVLIYIYELYEAPYPMLCRPLCKRRYLHSFQTPDF